MVGVVKTSAEGKASITLSLPEFAGQLRLVAVGSSKTASGTGAGSFVRRPFILRTSVPRFLLPGDSRNARWFSTPPINPHPPPCPGGS